MSNEITIEKIDAVIQRVPSATYAEAKQALIDHNGDVIESIIALESNKTTIESNLSKKTKQAKKAVEDMFSKDSEDFKEMKEQAKELVTSLLKGFLPFVDNVSVEHNPDKSVSYKIKEC